MATFAGRPWLEKYPPLTFVLRHIDDLPDITYTRHLNDVVEQAGETALGLALLGNIAAASTIIEILRSHHPNFLDKFNGDLVLKPCMYFAWEARGRWPDWIPAIERTEWYLSGLEERARMPWTSRFRPAYSVDKETGEEALAMSNANINLYFPDMSIDEKRKLVEQKYEADAYGYAANPNGPWLQRYVNVYMWWLFSQEPYPWIQLHNSAALTIALDIFLKLGDEAKAEEAWAGIVSRFTFHEQANMLAASRIAWKQLLLRPDRPLTTPLEVSDDDLDRAGARAIQKLQTRLGSGQSLTYNLRSHGALRPYQYNIVLELVHLISTHTYQNMDTGALATFGSHREQPADKTSLLRLPAYTPTLLGELERKLGTTLPDDYKDFLYITSGFRLPVWDGGFALGFLCAQEPKMVKHEQDHVTVDLLPSGSTKVTIDWPAMPDTVLELSDATVGCGELYLIDRNSTTAAKSCFFTQYQAKSAEEKEELDRLIVETYGSMDAFNELECALLAQRNWIGDTRPYHGVRGLLEVLAEESMRVLRPWNPSFEPQLKRLLNPGVDLFNDPWTP